MAASAVVRSITLLSALSLTSFYIGYITSSASGHRASTSTSDGRRLHENADPIANRIQKCYNYNYFSEACIHDNHEVHRLLDGVLHPKSRSKDSNELQRSSSGVKVGDVSGSFLTGSVAISKQDLMDRFDKFGVATLLSDTAEDALLLYNSFNSLPSNDPNYVTHQQFATSYANVTQALENCEAFNVQFVHNPSSSVLPMCNLYIPGLNNIPSFHIQRWMRQDEELRHVGSLTTPSGVDKFDLPKYHPVIFKHWEALRTFLENVDRVLDEVDSIIKERFEKLGIPDKTLIIMTINMGDADLLINFLCAAKSRNLDTRRILVFVTDDESKKLIESLAGDEIMVYHDKYNLASVKKGGGSQKFGDATFVSMMFVKILCVLYPSLLGYDVLYQDADIIWYQDPLDFFRGRHPESSERLKEYDVIFQHDGSPQPRFAPYSANSGFYYVRSNTATQYLFSSLLYHGDLIRKTTSHQQVLTQLLLEHSSMMGLKVKVLDDVHVFPGGYQYQHDKEYMHQLISGESKPIIFHMYWTDGKDSKVKFFQQFGEWRVQNGCSDDLTKKCCATQPLVSCHYRDKPSIIPCLDSPSYDKDGESFW